MRKLVNVSAVATNPLWVDPSKVVGVGGVADTPNDFEPGAWVAVEGQRAVWPVPRTGVDHVLMVLRASGASS